MSAFNTLRFRDRCPRCAKEQEFEAEVRFGVADGLELRVGDEVEWIVGDLHGGAVVDESGYTQCANCNVSLGVVTNVEGSRIVSARIRGVVDWERDPSF
jgi:hypothetical protein